MAIPGVTARIKHPLTTRWDSHEDKKKILKTETDKKANSVIGRQLQMNNNNNTWSKL